MGSILQSGRGLIREIKVPMQELELKMEGGVIAGFYGNINSSVSCSSIQVSVGMAK